MIVCSVAEVVVVHLASASLGRQHFKTFLESYERHPAGLEHQLVLVLNGFRDRETARQSGFLASADELDRQLICVHPLDIDLVVYLMLARSLPGKYMCFLNATSELLADDWLAKMHHHAEADDIGLVGATGSYGTHRGAPARGRLSIVGTLRTRWAFPPFPNPHIRTNAFMIRRQLFADLRTPTIANKRDAYRLESGREGFTAQLRRKGLRPVIVGNDGTGYDLVQWPTSATFHAAEQQNLLIADRRTREWDAATADARARMSRAAWGIENPFASEPPA